MRQDLSTKTLTVIAVFLGSLFLGVTAAFSATVSAKQATLEQQTSCTDSGGTITAWHFVINQIDSQADAPSYITVNWSNGDSEQVDMAKFTGKVAHYDVSGTSDHTLITSATADIYDGWSGQFNLSDVTCGPGTPPADACTPYPNRIIVNFNNVFLGDPALFPIVTDQSQPFPINVAPGTYAITLKSYDDHSVKGGQGQMEEQWYARFTTGLGTVDSSPIADLPDNQDYINQQVGDVTFLAPATQVVARHLLAGGTFPTPDSIHAVCVALDPVSPLNGILDHGHD